MKKRFSVSIEVDTDGKTFGTNERVALDQVLRNVINDTRHGSSGVIKDFDGTVIGTWALE